MTDRPGINYFSTYLTFKFYFRVDYLFSFVDIVVDFSAATVLNSAYSIACVLIMITIIIN